MAVGNQPNDVYLLETVLAEFRQISRGNGNYTDIQDVVLPSYHLTDGNPMAFVINPAVLSHDKLPALFVWVDRSSPAEGLMGMAERTLHLVVVGVLKQDEGLQLALMRLANDVRGIMLFNRERRFPGASSAENTGAATNEVGDGVGFNILKNSHGHNVGYFVSFWAVSHKVPGPQG